MDKSKIALVAAPAVVATMALASSALTVDGGRITISKTATKIYEQTADNNLEYGRMAKVNVNVKARPYKANAKVDVVMVLDDSGSMASGMDGKEVYGSGGSRISQLKSAANGFIDELMTDNSDNHIKLGVAIFSSSGYHGSGVSGVDGYDLTSSKSAAKGYISKLRAEGATNLQGGINKAKELLDENAKDSSRDSAKKIVLVLSDGVPTAYNYTSGGRTYQCGDLSQDSTTHGRILRFAGGIYQDNTPCPYTTPSDNARDAMNSLKSAYPDADIYTIRFNEEEDAQGDLTSTLIKVNPAETTSSHVYQNVAASDSSDLLDKFKQSVSKVGLTIGTEGVVTDTIDKEFDLTDDSKDTLQKAGVQITSADDGSTVLTWRIGNIVASDDGYTLQYEIKAKDDYHGSIYTGAAAQLSTIVSDDNPYKDYKSLTDRKLSLASEHPAVEIPAITANDSYHDISSYQGYADAPINGPTILANDTYKETRANVSDSGDNAGVSDKVVIREDDNVKLNENNKYEISKDGTLQGKLSLKDDGTFEFIPEDGVVGEVTFRYRIETTVEEKHETNHVYSNDATVTLNLLPRETRTIKIEGTFPKEESIIKPSSVTIKLNADDEEVEKKTTPVVDSKIEEKFEDVPVYEPEHENDEDQKIDYTVEQEKAKGFTPTIKGDPDTGFTITNVVTTEEKNENEPTNEPVADDNNKTEADKKSEANSETPTSDDKKSDKSVTKPSKASKVDKIVIVAPNTGVQTGAVRRVSSLAWLLRQIWVV